MICIIFIGDLYVCPYMNIYTNQLEKEGAQYDVLFWNRSGEKMQLSPNYKACEIPSEEEQSVIFKFFDFMRFRKWLKRQLKNGNYDKIFVLSTLSGMLICDLLRKYKKKYFFDIRDYSYENIKLFYLIEKRVIENSFATSISSPGFENFLPKCNYIIAHNIQLVELDTPYTAFPTKEGKKVINIVWNGTMRYFKHQKKIIDKLVNDERFALYYHGAGPELSQYMEYCDTIGAKNIFFTGRYNNSDKALLLENADIINNSYWIEKENEVMYAISNRFYDGLIYKIPQLSESGTYKAGLCEKYGIGIGIDPEEDGFADHLYNWYKGLDRNEFHIGCETLLGIVRNDTEKYEEEVKRFIIS